MKDEALRMALEALEKSARNWPSDSVIEAITAIKQALEAPVQEPDAYGYAKRLAEAIWKAHYKVTAPNWMPLNTVLGVLTQIDNMTSGLTTPPAAPVQEPVEPEPFGYFQYDIRLDAWVQNRINNKGVSFYTKEKP